MMIVPLQLKINNSYNEINTLANNNRVMFIYNDDKEFFRKCREIWNKIIELIGINNAKDFVKNTIDDDDEFIMVDVHKNTSFVEGNYRDKLVIVLHSIIDNYLKTSLIQVKRHKCTQIHQLIISISIQSMHVYHNYYKTIFTFFLYFYKKKQKNISYR